jgi:hypothetical protein
MPDFRPLLKENREIHDGSKYNTHVGGVIMGAHQKDVVEGFIHDEICYDIPGSKKNSYIPVTTSITLRRAQQILVNDWYGCYLAIKGGRPCK